MIRECCRIGQKRGDKPRSLKLCLSDSEIVNQLLRKARLLRIKDRGIGHYGGGRYGGGRYGGGRYGGGRCGGAF